MKNEIIAYLATVGFLLVLWSVLPHWIVGIISIFSFVILAVIHDQITNGKK